jgi:hypothetical protein
MNRTTRARGALLSAFVFVWAWAIAGCGSPQFHAIGYGWPLQCNTIRELYETRTSEGYAALDRGAVSSDAHATLAVSEVGLAVGVAELLGLAEREIERAFATLEVPGANDSGEIDLHFSARTINIVDRTSSPAIDVRAGGRGHATIRWPAGIVTETDFRVGAMFRFAVALEFVDGSARVVFDPDGSDIDHFEFSTETQTDEHGNIDIEWDDNDLLSWIQTALVNTIDGPILAAVGRRPLLSIAPVRLGETGILAEPLSLVADEQANTLRMSWGTSLDIGPIDAHSTTIGSSDAAIFVPAQVLAPLARQITNASAGRRVDGDGRPDPNGDIWTFFENLVVDGDQLVLTYSVYNRASPCAFIVFEVHVHPVIRDGRIHLDLYDRRMLEGSRQRWLIRSVVPALDQMEGIVNEGVASTVTDRQDSELASGATLRVRFDSVEVTPAGILIRASLDTDETP